MIVSGDHLMGSAIHTHVFILPQTPSPPRLPHNIEQSSLCCSRSRWLSILNIAVSMLIPNSLTIHSPHPSLLVTISWFSKSVSLFPFCKCIHLYHFFLDSTYKGRLRYLSFSDFIQYDTLGPCMLLQMALFHSF